MKINEIHVKPGMPLEEVSKTGNLLIREEGKELVVNGNNSSWGDVKTIARAFFLGKNSLYLHTNSNSSYLQEESRWTSSFKSLLNDADPGSKYTFDGKTQTAFEWAKELEI